MQKLLTSFQDCLDILKMKAPKTITPQKKADIIFKAACKVLKIDPKVIPMQRGIQKRFQFGNVAQYKLEVIRTAVVGKHKFDWNSWDEKKWFPWFWMNKPGFRLAGVYYGYGNAHTTSGARLCFRTQEQARWIGTDCIWLYKELNNGPALAPAAIKALQIAA